MINVRTPADLRPKNDQMVAQWADYNKFVREWAGYWLFTKLKLIALRRNTVEMTGITQLWRKGDLWPVAALGFFSKRVSKKIHLR